MQTDKINYTYWNEICMLVIFEITLHMPRRCH